MMKSEYGLNRHNVDMYGIGLYSHGEIASYIKSISLYCVERDEKYIHFPPAPLRESFKSKKITGEYFGGESDREICFQPQIENLVYLRCRKMIPSQNIWSEITLRLSEKYSIIKKIMRETT